MMYHRDTASLNRTKVFSPDIAQSFCYAMEWVSQLQNRIFYEVNFVFIEWIMTNHVRPKKKTSKQGMPHSAAVAVVEPVDVGIGMGWLTENIQ